ncbi:MAG: type II toxin-antitoxin system prevent-host-death family antitoxin [Desulfobacterales bacterium]|nr:type II toxin-antitoxin system prevent-host-death family antitoxin [Desulfobacterales bacterium]
MEINVKEARSKISTLLDLTQKGEEIVILRRGKKAARLVPAEPRPKHLPDLTAFRNSINVKGSSFSNAVRQGRNEERY